VDIEKLHGGLALYCLDAESEKKTPLGLTVVVSGAIIKKGKAMRGFIIC